MVRYSDIVLWISGITKFEIQWVKTFCFRFDKVAGLGHHILAKDPNADDIKDKLRQLADDHRGISELWNKKNQDLADARDLQVLTFKERTFYFPVP